MQAVAAPQTPAALGTTVPDAVKVKLKAKSDEFETFYIYQFIELMQPKDTGGFMNGGPGEELFRHNLNEQMAKNISQQGGFGISSQVYGQLLKLQEQQSPTGVQ